MAAPIAVSSDGLDELLKGSDNLFGFEVSDNILEEIESNTIDVLQKDGNLKAIKKYSRVPNCAGGKYSFYKFPIVSKYITCYIFFNTVNGNRFRFNGNRIPSVLMGMVGFVFVYHFCRLVSRLG